MGKIPPASVGSVGLIPDQGALIPCALQPKTLNSIVTNSIKTSKMIHRKKKKKKTLKKCTKGSFLDALSFDIYEICLYQLSDE